MKYKVQISTGELFDKLSILQIKLEKVKDKEKLKFIEKEYNELKKASENQFSSVEDFYKKLYNVNKKLWKLENKVRQLEEEKLFGKDFIDAARNIYKYNDKRALIKSKINTLTNSEFYEIKQHN